MIHSTKEHEEYEPYENEAHALSVLKAYGGEHNKGKLEKHMGKSHDPYYENSKKNK